MKPLHRLDHSRLAEALAERGLCDPAALREALKLSGHGTLAFAEAVVNANLVGDWELGKVVSEIYNLPFLPLDLCVPDPAALEGVDLAYLCQHGLVPLARFGNVLTIAMPGMVTADVLTRIPVKDQNTIVVPVVASVQGNRRWIEQNLEKKLHAQMTTLKTDESDVGAGQWGSLFDEADAAVFDVLNPSQSGSDLSSDLPSDLAPEIPQAPSGAPKLDIRRTRPGAQ